MSRPLQIVLPVLLVGLAGFGAGAWYASSRKPAFAEKPQKVLYYQDPMHPAYRSDKPGIAPDCGMQLEPVYERGGSAAASSKGPQAMPGTVEISAERQRMLGVRVEEVRLNSGTHTVRLLGRTVPDESRLYKINSTIDGWIRGITPVATTGNLVHKDETLATYNAPEFLGPMQAYLYALNALDRFRENIRETESQLALTRANIQQAKNSLITLGMSELQANEMTKTQQLTEDIRIVAPATGFIIVRNIFPGQRFEKGTEFFRIADLSSVWVMADIFEKDRELARPGASATVRYQGRALHARMSNVLPQFDPASRTLKARFELDNPGYVLRPDMFVDVEFQASLPAAIAVPVDAVIDSGLRKTVYVETSDGSFVPRQVETGWRLGDSVEIVSGLTAGERIVASGNFLLDSESRMRLSRSR
jgi:Cu(I)/Ag(I) efflux system membrane fusion protein